MQRKGVISGKGREILCLYEISEALNSPLELSKCLYHILEIMAYYMNINQGAIIVLEPYTLQVQIEVFYGPQIGFRRQVKHRLKEGIIGQVVTTGEPVIKQERRVSCLSVPIKTAEEVLGALTVHKSYSDDMQIKNDLRFLTIVASLIVQSVQNMQITSAEKEELLQENLLLKTKLKQKYNLSNIVGQSPKMQKVFEMIARVAETDATVLIRGESGTGKELVANAIHYNSTRAQGPFVKINCAALPETLMESELFGYERGAFTGAYRSKAGKFELAQGGTIFLDEIGELSLSVQAKLLRVIQEKEFYRVGGTQPIKANVRIIAATNQDLEKALAEKTFREDLYYRLNVFPIYLPPLRERRSDILLLAEYFLEEFNKEYGKDIHHFSTAAVDMLMQYHWPGNVRELKNCIERAVLICEGEVIESHHFPPTLQTAEISGPVSHLSLTREIERLEKEMIIEALKATKGNCSQAAKWLDTTLRVINYKIKKYGIEPKIFRSSRDINK